MTCHSKPAYTLSAFPNFISNFVPHFISYRSQEILVPSELAIKVFKTTLNEFKTREKYIADDYRFKDRYKHLNPHKIVKLWAEKVNRNESFY